MKRDEILDHTKEIIMKDRAQTHGGAEDSFNTIALMWTVYLDIEVSAADVCAMMSLLKIARIKGNPTHADSWIDTCGYAAIGGSISTEPK